MRKLMTMALLCAMCVAAFADKEIYKGGLLYHCFDATMTAEVRISDYHDTYEMDVVVPETVETDGKIYTVTSIGEYTFTYALHSISLPNTIRSIGKRAFYGCNLTSIKLPESLEVIGEGAFYNSKLESVTIPEGVRKIGDDAFDGSSSLKNVVLPSNLERIGDYAFALCESLTAIELPASLKSIGERGAARWHHRHTVLDFLPLRQP